MPLRQLACYCFGLLMRSLGVCNVDIRGVDYWISSRPTSFASLGNDETRNPAQTPSSVLPGSLR